MKRTIQNKLIFSVVGAIVFFGFLSAYFVYTYSSGVFLKSEQDNFNTVVKKTSDHITYVMSTSESIVKTMSKNNDIISYMSSVDATVQDDRILEILQNYNIDDAYSAIYIIGKDGLAKTSTDLSFVGNNYSLRDYFVNSISGSFFVDAVVSVQDNQLGYYFSAPIMDNNNNILGVAVLKIKPEVIYKDLVLDEHYKYSDIMITDNYGIIIYSNKPDRLFKSIGRLSEADLQEIKDKKDYSNSKVDHLGYDVLFNYIRNKDFKQSIVKIYDEVDKEEEFLGTSKIGNYPFYMIIEQSYGIYSGYIRSISYILAFFVFFAAFFCIFLLTFLILKFLKPLRDLVDASKKVSAGDYNVILQEEQGTEEMSKLFEAYNEMLLNIRESKLIVEKDVKKKTQEIVEKQKELENKNLAMLNVLEDANKERENANRLADDLEKFKLAVENASDHIVITDKDGVVVYVNKAAERITGYSAKEIVGKKAGVLWGGLMEESYYKKMWDIILFKKKTFSGEMKNKRKNGKEYYAFVSISPILGTNDDVAFFVGIERDITQEKEIDKAKTEFVSLASHQLRTPLSAISWYSEMLLAGDAGDLNKDQKNYLNEIYQGNKRMVELVNALLNVSRIELGTFTVQPEEADLLKLINDSLNEFKIFLKKKKISVITDFDNNLPKARVDFKLTKIIFDNLISNAVKYTKENGNIKITVGKNSKNFILSFKDSGVGIPKNQQKDLFKKLFRADNVRGMDTEGTGLGLYMVKSILDAAGGTVTILSEENKGTEVKITIPLAGMKQKKGTKNLT